MSRNTHYIDRRFVEDTSSDRIAVYNPADETRSSFKKCYQLSSNANRVRHIAPADFRAGSHLRLLLEQMVEDVATRILDHRAREVEAGVVRAPRHA